MGQLLYHCLKRKNMVKINDLMKIEKSLLEINTNHKFELPFDDFISFYNKCTMTNIKIKTSWKNTRNP